MDFKTELKEYQKIIETELDKYLRKEECPEKVLNQAAEYSLKTFKANTCFSNI